MNASKLLKLSSLMVFFALVLSSCTSDMQRSLQPTPAAFGKINSLTVIADSSLWFSGYQDSVDYFFGAPYIILPQPEPIFDLHYIDPYRLSAQPAWQQLRNYIVLANLGDEDSRTPKMVMNDLSDAKIQQVKQEGFGTAVGKNKWATGQQLIYLMGKNEQELRSGLSAAYPAVVRRLKDRESDRVDATAYFNGENNDLQEQIELETGARIRIPRNYVRAPIQGKGLIWLRKQVAGGSLNILLTTVPYEDQNQLTAAGLKIVRDKVGKEYISSSEPGTYMRINDEDLPLFTEPTELNGSYAVESRGIWEMENGFMAGPFVSYLMHDPEKKELLFVDGFVFAPGQRKRDMMEELTHVLRTTNY
jgi:hypothetical protein